MNKNFNIKHIKYYIIICSLLCPILNYGQVNTVLFQEEFENNALIYSLWGQSSKYTITSGISGNCMLFNSNTIDNQLVSTSIPLQNLHEQTIALSASIKGEELTGEGHLGMVVQIVATASSGILRYARVPIHIGTFDWEQVGTTYKIDSDIVALKIEIGLFNATGKLWLDNIHIQVIADAMPPARDISIPINKTHAGMYRGMNIVSNTILRTDLEELSTEWKASSIRCMIGGNQYSNRNLLDSDFDSILQIELTRMDTIVSWCNSYDLRLIVGLAGLKEGLFDSKAAQTKLIDTWRLIAQRYKNNNTVWAYDLANEPIYNYKWPLDSTILFWPSLADTLAKAIRVIDTEKSIIIESLNYGLTLDDITPVDFNIKNIIYSIHMYSPHPLTHQQITGPTPTYSYPGIIEGKYYDKNILKELLQPVKDYQEKYRIPIYIGEFSCIRWASENSSYNYIRDCIEIFEEYNWDWSYHAFRGWDGWSVEHSTVYYDPILPTIKTDRELLLRSYFQKTPTTVISPKQKDSLVISYPNPANNELNINVGKLEIRAGTIRISDSQGKLLAQLYFNQEENIKIDISSISNGFYIYSLYNLSGDLLTRGKFIKQQF